jgi:hypothetical protein
MRGLVGSDHISIDEDAVLKVFVGSSSLRIANFVFEGFPFYNTNGRGHVEGAFGLSGNPVYSGLG